MENIHFEKFRNVLSQYTANPFSESLLMKQGNNLEVYYSPFEHINQEAKLVLVGISPGATQAHNANLKSQELLRRGLDDDEVSKQAKLTGAFSGALRNSLVNMLNHIGINTRLGIANCDSLFSDSQHLLHSTSVFRYPTLINGKPISSAKKGLKEPVLKQMIDDYLSYEAEQLSSEAYYLPMGQGVDSILLYLCDKGILNRSQVLIGMPHPSGANAERVSYFLGNKPKEKLSAKTNSDKIDKAKKSLLNQLRVA